MTSFSDPKYLREKQYRTTKNLNARVSLHQRFRTNPYPWHRWVFDQIQEPDFAKIFEIGCGPAYLWAENLERIPESWSIHLLDLSLGMVTAARDSLKNREFSYLAGDAQDIPAETNKFDAVIANHMLFHIPDLERALSNIRRILKPGGRLYATTNGFRNLIEIWEWAAQALTSRNDILTSRKSVLNFSLENGEELLLRYFSSIALTQYPDSLEINEAPPIVDFVVSSSMQIELDEAELLTYLNFLEHKLTVDKVLKVTKNMCIFCGRIIRFPKS